MRVKIQTLYLALLMSIFFSMCLYEQAYAASKKCYGGNDIYVKNRFKDCNIGDAITVIIIISNRIDQTVHDMSKGVIFLNEVSRFCSFARQITLTGIPDAQKDGKLTRVFDCIYIGRKREFKVETEK